MDEHFRFYAAFRGYFFNIIAAKLPCKHGTGKAYLCRKTCASQVGNARLSAGMESKLRKASVQLSGGTEIRNYHCVRTCLP